MLIVLGLEPFTTFANVIAIDEGIAYALGVDMLCVFRPALRTAVVRLRLNR